MKTVMKVILTAAIAVTASGEEFVKWPENGHFYKAVYVPKGISWTQAKAEAKRAGGYLATITSSKENKFVFSLIDEDRFWNIITTNYGNENMGPWIGGYQEDGANEPAGGWKWVTGEKFRYKRWASGEPTGTWKGRNENRLHYWNLGTRRPYWNDMTNSLRGFEVLGYVIEKEETKP